MIKGSDIHTKDSGRDHSIAIAEIYANHFDDVWRWLNALGVRPADLEDAAQEVFVVVHRRLASFEGRSRLTTWLFGICTRVAAGFRRKAHVARESFDAELESLVDGATSRPDEAAANGQMRELLNRVLDDLDEQKRAVLVLYELEGMTLQEISDLMSTPLQTVYTRLRAARDHLRQGIEQVTRDREEKR